MSTLIKRGFWLEEVSNCCKEEYERKEELVFFWYECNKCKKRCELVKKERDIKIFFLGRFKGEKEITIFTRDKNSEYPYQCIGSDEIFKEEEVEVFDSIEIDQNEYIKGE